MESSSIASQATTNVDWIKSFASNLVGSISKVRHTKSVERAVFKASILEFADWEVDLDAYIEAEYLTEKEAL